MITSIEKLATELTLTEGVIMGIMANYNGLTVDSLHTLITATNGKGCKFMNIKGYSSDKSDNTEISEVLVNIGIAYENMVGKDAITLNTYDIDTIQTVLKDDVLNHNFGKYNLSKFADAKNPANEVLALLPAALIDMKSKPETVRADNNIKLNKSLWYNINTNSLLVFGQQINKTVTVKGDFKPVASAPLTVAKNIIRDTLKKSDLRTFKVANIIGQVKANGDTLLLS